MWPCHPFTLFMLALFVLLTHGAAVLTLFIAKESVPFMVLLGLGAAILLAILVIGRAVTGKDTAENWKW